MYNISPIEVYIENRSAAPANVFNMAQYQQHAQSTTQKANKKQQPNASAYKVSAEAQNSHVVMPSGQNSQGNTSNPLELEAQIAGTYASKRSGQQPLADAAGNVSNTYFSYYQRRQENAISKSPTVTQKNLQFSTPVVKTPGMNTAGIPKDSDNSPPRSHNPRSQNTDITPLTDKSNLKLENEKTSLGPDASRKAVSNLNLEPKYKLKEQQEGGLRIGNQLRGGLGVEYQLKRDAQVATTQNTSFLIKQAEMQGTMELHELQEQTAEDNMSFQDGLNKAQKGGAGSKKSPIDLTQYGISNRQQPYVDHLVQNFSLYQAQGTKEVEKMLQYLYSKNQLSNTYEVLAQIGQLKNKQILKSQSSNMKMIQPDEVRELHDLLRTNPDVIALNLDKQTQEEIIETLTALTKYEQEGKVHREHIYLQNEAIKGKRNYEELYYRQRSLKHQQTFLEMLEKKMARVEGKPNQELDPAENLRPKYLDDEQKIRRRR